MRNYLMGLILSKAVSRVGRYAGRKVKRERKPAKTGIMRKLVAGAGVVAVATWLIGRKSR
jgi:hypothetical protein